MPVLDADGFDFYGTPGNAAAAGWLSNGAAYSVVGGRFGGYAINWRTTSVYGHQVWRNFPTPCQRFIFGLARYVNTIASHDLFWLSDDIGTTHIIFAKSEYDLIVRHGNGSTLITAANFFLLNAFTYIEADITIDDTAGAVSLYKNGAQIAAVGPIDTRNGGNPWINRITFHAPYISSVIDNIYDDWYLIDPSSGSTTAPLYDARIECLMPVADTAQKDWTPNGGTNNYSRVAEANADGDSTYVTDSTPGHVDLYDLAALGGAPSHIAAVKLFTLARKDDAGLRQIRNTVKSGPVVAAGHTSSLGTSYAYTTDLLELNPDGNVPWTVAAINALQSGVEMVT